MAKRDRRSEEARSFTEDQSKTWLVPGTADRQTDSPLLLLTYVVWWAAFLWLKKIFFFFFLRFSFPVNELKSTGKRDADSNWSTSISLNQLSFHFHPPLLTSLNLQTNAFVPCKRALLMQWGWWAVQCWYVVGTPNSIIRTFASLLCLFFPWPVIKWMGANTTLSLDLSFWPKYPVFIPFAGTFYVDKRI